MENAMPIRFDKLKFVQTLERKESYSKEQAETLAEALDEALYESQSSLLTKSEFQVQMAQLEARLTANMYKMAGLIVAGIGVLMTLMKLF